MSNKSKTSAITFAGIGLLLTACGGGGGSSSNSSPPAATQEQASGKAALSYYNAAKPLLERYCVSCHNDSRVTAPFPLETYQQVYNKRSAMVYALESQTMPPLGYTSPTGAENQLLLDWLNTGAVKGNESQAPLPTINESFTYHGDARAIIEERCLGCHVEGGIAPFALDTYDNVRTVAAAAAFSIRNNTMPPWPPSEGFTPLLHSRDLSDREKYVLLNWLEGDLEEGNPANYQAPPEEPASPSPNYNLEMQLPEAYTPTLRPDDHRCFAIDWPLDTFSYVTDVSVRPDVEEEVHHVIVSVADPEDAHLYVGVSGEDGRPGWYCPGMGGVSGAPFPRQIGGWVPGVGREPAPADTGIGVEPGSIMIVQMHYNTVVADPAPDQSTILVATADTVERPALSFLMTQPQFLLPGGMAIPAGDPEVTHQVLLPASFLARARGGDLGIGPGDPWTIHQNLLHMHNLGVHARSTLVRADGTEQVLVDIDNWDFNWQGSYNFEQELLVQPNDWIKMACTWDNSQANQPFVNDVQQISDYVEWGSGTGDEMCVFSLLMTKPAEGQDYSYHPSVYIASPEYRQQFKAGDLIPLRLRLNNFSLHDPAEHAHSGEDQHTDAGADAHDQVFQGHYHVYLDTDDDTADHLTAWDDNYYFQLPADITSGLHTLRVNLRGADHHGLGIEHEIEFEVIEDTAEERISLANVNDWAFQSAANDSLSMHRPEEISCPDNSWYNEGGTLEVETGYCDYLSLGQPGQTAVETGDTLHLVLWHGDLAFEEPASAHVAISIAGKKVWESDVDIPRKAEIFDVRIPINFNAPKGSDVEYHLHNHGYNTWTLLKLEVER